MKTTVIHHSADYDGIFCREIARKFLPDAELIGWDFADAPLSVARLAGCDKLYILDLPCDRPFGFKMEELIRDDRAKGCRIGDCANIIWIDHHKSSIDSHPKSIPGYRIDGVAACRLAWQWFARPTTAEGIKDGLPSKDEYDQRLVSEPLAVRLAGEYDVWDKRDPDAETFQYALRCGEVSSAHWEELLGPAGDHLVEGFLQEGRVAQRYQQKTDASVMLHRSFIVKWEGLTFLALNTARCNSNTFAALDKPETGHDALMGFFYNGKKFTFSLYHAGHRKDLDLSQIAVKYGGGGHRGACGFQSAELPFL